MILDSINRVFVSAMLAAKREDGQTFVEYSLIGFIVAVAVAAIEGISEETFHRRLQPAIPARFALMSGAPSYNVFHLGFGALGTALVLARSATAIAAFNLAFGIADVYQVVAGLTGWFPARPFRYKPADHVVHAVIGVGLGAVGWMGLR